VGQETELIATLPPRLDLVGLAMRAGRKVVDKIVDALKLSQLATRRLRHAAARRRHAGVEPESRRDCALKVPVL
jgi:hypothetical protein